MNKLLFLTCLLLSLIAGCGGAPSPVVTPTVNIECNWSGEGMEDNDCMVDRSGAEGDQGDSSGGDSAVDVSPETDVSVVPGQ